jgi:hypothetical protein
LVVISVTHKLQTVFPSFQQRSPIDDDAQLNKFRDSATSGNGVGIVQTAHSGLKPKLNSTTQTVVNLEDEDDTVERESILQSPPKGTKRISSGVSCFNQAICFV